MIKHRTLLSPSIRQHTLFLFSFPSIHSTTWPLKRPTSTSLCVVHLPIYSNDPYFYPLKLVIRPPKSFRNKAPRGRATHPTGPPIRSPPSRLCGPRTRLYRPVVIVALVLVLVVNKGGRTWDGGDVPGPVRARAHGFAAMLESAAGEDARNARLCDGLCQDVAFGECRTS